MKFFGKVNRVLQSKAASLSIAVIALLCPFINWCLRTGYVFIDHEVFNGFAYTLFALMIVNAAVIVGLLMLRRFSPKAKDRAVYKVFYYLAMVFTAFFFIYDVMQPVLFPQEVLVYWSFFKASFPAAAVIYFALFLILAMPMLPKGKVRAIVSGGMLTALLLAIFIPAFHLTPYAFASEPVVFDNGKEYSIVFATNDIGNGYASTRARHIGFTTSATERYEARREYIRCAYRTNTSTATAIPFTVAER